MKKIFLFLLYFILVASFSFAQNMTLPGNNSSGSSSVETKGVPINFMSETTLKKQVDDIGLKAANSLMRCCSSYGGNNVYAEVDYENCRVEKETNTFFLPMKIGWYGSLTGTHYWIKGKLVIGEQSREWLKISDSGGFNPGCSKNCIN